MSPKNIIKNIAIAIVIIAVIVIAGLAFNKYTTQEITDPKQTRLQKVKVGKVPTFDSLYLKVGEVKGYFTESGLDVEPIEYQSGNQLVDALVRGDVDAVCCSGIVAGLDAQVASPDKIKIFTVQDDSGGVDWNKLIVKNESTIKSIQDLAGKKVAVFPGSIAAPTFKKYLEKNNVDISKLETVPTPAPNQITALESGSVDALWAYDPNGVVALSTGKYRQTDNSIYYKLNSKSSSGAGFISSKFINEKPVLASKFVKATSKSFKFIQENNSESKTISASLFKYEPDVVAKLNLAYYFENSKIDINRTQEYVDFLYEIGIIKQKVNIAEMFYRAE
jgi:ABC-type nitrate/sulfonate/bicarbonate transport system substrate-binding protein